MQVYKMVKTGRVAYDFPWESSKVTCPWDAHRYARVVIPFTAAERRNSRGTCHIQVVKRCNLELLKEHLH